MQRRIRRRIRLIRVRRTYTMSELADFLQVHVRTVQAWHNNGLIPIEPSGRPLLFLGYEVNRFLIERRDRRKCRLGKSEFYCPRCKAARQSLPGEVQGEYTGRRMGHSDELVIIKGKCAECGCSVRRFSTRSQWDLLQTSMMDKQAQAVLKGDQYTLLFTDLEQGRSQ